MQTIEGSVYTQVHVDHMNSKKFVMYPHSRCACKFNFFFKFNRSYTTQVTFTVVCVYPHDVAANA